MMKNRLPGGPTRKNRQAVVARKAMPATPGTIETGSACPIVPNVKQAIMPKPLPNGLMAMLSDELIEAWDALSPHLPGHGALTYFGFAHAE